MRAAGGNRPAALIGPARRFRAEPHDEPRAAVRIDHRLVAGKLEAHDPSRIAGRRGSMRGSDGGGRPR